MKTGFLNDDEVRQIHSIMARHGIEQFDAAIRFWGRGKAISVDGVLDEKHLTCLLDIARALSPQPQAEQGVAPATMSLAVSAAVPAITAAASPTQAAA
ncbi:hypothetical protein SAMN04488068_1201 [Hydrocarboniphaga daqingensis]|uniref:Uncharacterized protein n=1 Tax=Hydrocarboniphaga daqingensis TaxID=490188 RepID=A0A1M5M0E8_9GAMM|nr:hypothetical protein [Hydrocarboniphaga daqingensis]SHG70824.1 hypothetical protein SAMN04488068_1201 [Hydrocarboniphaga daqingensis]